MMIRPHVKWVKADTSSFWGNSSRNATHVFRSNSKMPLYSMGLLISFARGQNVEKNQNMNRRENETKESQLKDS